MSKRIRPQGFVTCNPIGSHAEGVRRDGVKYNTTFTPEASFQRKVGKAEYIVSQSGNDARFRPCDHVKELHIVVANPNSIPPQNLDYHNRWVSGPGSPLNPMFKSTSGYEAGAHAKDYSRYISTVNNGIAAFNNLGSLSWETMQQTALVKMLPSLRSDNSLFNFVVELKDWKELYAALTTGRVAKLRDVISALTGIEKANLYRSSWRKGLSLRQLSKVNLQYNFALKPLYRDVLNLSNSFLLMKKKLKDIKKKANVATHRHYRSFVPGTAFDGLTTIRTPAISGGYVGLMLPTPRTRQTQYASKGIEYCASLRYRYPFPPVLDTFEGQFSAYLDTLGLNFNPKALWDAVPWSFAVDWLVNVGRFLDQFRVENIRFQTEILDFCHSMKVKREYEYAIAPSFFAIAPPEKWSTSAEPTITKSDGAFVTTDMCSFSHYERRTGIPNYKLAIQTSGLNLHEFSMAGSLVGSRRRP